MFKIPRCNGPPSVPKCPSQGPHLRSLLRALSCQPCPSPSLTARPLRREPGLRARQGLTAGSTRTRAAQGRQRPVPTGPGPAPVRDRGSPTPSSGPAPTGRQQRLAPRPPHRDSPLRTAHAPPGPGRPAPGPAPAPAQSAPSLALLLRP